MELYWSKKFLYVIHIKVVLIQTRLFKVKMLIVTPGQALRK